MGDVLVLNQDTSEYKAGIYDVAENPYGKGTLQRGTDYTDSITLHKSQFPNNVSFDWSWPSPYNSIRSYPLLKYGNLSGPYPQVSQLWAISTSFDFSISASSSVFSVLHELWLVSDAAGSVLNTEMQLYPVSPSGSESANANGSTRYVFPGIPYNFYVWQSTWKHIYIYPQNNAFVTIATIDWKAFIAALIGAGVLTGNEYLKSIQIGPEIVSGAGNLDLKTYSVTQK